MTDKVSILLQDEQQGHAAVMSIWKLAKAHLSEQRRMLLTLEPETRTLAQNRLMFSCLKDLSNQVEWFHKRMTPIGWKCWITGHLNGQDLHPDMHGTGFISVTSGQSTSAMSIKEMTAVIDLAHAFGADKGVVWSPTSLGVNQ